MLPEHHLLLPGLGARGQAARDVVELVVLLSDLGVSRSRIERTLPTSTSSCPNSLSPDIMLMISLGLLSSPRLSQLWGAGVVIFSVEL